MLKNENIFLRQVEFQDIDIIYIWENQTENWMVSDTRIPLSRHLIEKYINSSQNIFENLQLRFMICENNKNENVVGIIDLFDYDSFNQRIGVGILINRNDRKKGFAFQSIELIKDYCFNYLLVNQIFCDIEENNFESINLFEKSGFINNGKKHSWIRTKDKYLNVNFYQCFK